jgi:hypothetical protein
MLQKEPSLLFGVEKIGSYFLVIPGVGRIFSIVLKIVEYNSYLAPVAITRQGFRSLVG